MTDTLVEVGRGATVHNTVTAMAYDRDGTALVFAGGDGGIIDVFRIGDDGTLIDVEKQPLEQRRGPGRGFVAAEVDGKHFLFAGNKGGDAIEVFEIAEDGQLERVSITLDTADTHIAVVITLRVVQTPEGAFLYAGGLEFDTPGLTCYRIAADGSLEHVQSMLDTDELHTDGIIAMWDTTIDGAQYLVTGGFQDNGISSFRLNDDGTFENVSNIADNKTDRYLTGTYPLDGVTLGGNHYVVVGHRHHKYYKRGNFIKQTDFVYHGDAVSVFKLESDGTLVPHSLLIDDESTKLQGQTRIEVLKIDEHQAIIAVGTKDDASIQLARLDAEGILTPTGQTSPVFEIYYGLASITHDGNHYIFAGSVENSVKELVSYRVETAE
ncbi:MAG: stress protein [Planctomycetota bacterium]